MATKNPLDGLKIKTHMVLAKHIKTNTFVRTGLDQDRVQLLNVLRESGVVLGPIVIIPDFDVKDGMLNFLHNDKYAIVDGRHRYWMETAILGSTEIKSQIILAGLTTEAQFISVAFRSNNTGGPKQPNQGDIEHTVELLLEGGTPKKDIPGLLDMPEKAIRKFVNDVEIRVAHEKTARSYQLVIRKDMSIPDAAKAEGTTPEKLRNYIAGKKRRNKAEKIEIVSRDIGTTFKSLNSKIHGTVRQLIKLWHDGDVTAEEVMKILKKLEERCGGTVKIIDDLKARFAAKAIHRGK